MSSFLYSFNLTKWDFVRWEKLFFWLFLISVPFGSRILLFKFTPGFHEYESVFLYASDFLMIIFLVLFFLIGKFYSNVLENIRIDKFIFNAGFLFLVFSGFSVLTADYKFLAFYNFTRLVLLILSAFAIGKLLKTEFLKLEKILMILAGLAIFESLIGFFQFYYQKSLGLWFLGESFLGSGIKGIAKIDIGSEHFLRAYGTFPHPNILATFLLLGLFSLYYFWLKVPSISEKPKVIGIPEGLKHYGLKYPAGKFYSNVLENIRIDKLFYLLNDIVVSSGIYLVLLGLVLTFSRAAWLIAIILSAAFIFYLAINKNYRNQSFRLLALLLVAGYSLFVILGWAISPRVKISGTEPAVSQRLVYNKLGLEIIKDNPWGIGIGNQVIYAVQNGLYQKLGMDKAWQWQPLHNIYLLIASEIGIFGLIAFLIFIIKLLISKSEFFRLPALHCETRQACPPTARAAGDDRRAGNLEFGIFKIMFLALLIFGLFDHFLWTLQPGKLMFWLVVGLIMGIRPHSSMDRA